MKSCFFEKIIDQIRCRDKAKAALYSVGYWLALLTYLELLLHVSRFGMPDWKFLFVLGFAAVFACVLALLVSFLPKRIHFPVVVVLTAFLILLYGSQMIYHFVFGTLYSVAQIQQGGQAITSFFKEMMLTIRNRILWILPLLLPIAGLILLRIFKKKMFQPANGSWRALLAAAALLMHFAMILCLNIGGTGYFTNHYFYYNNSTTVDQAVQRFGLLTAFRLDIFATEQEPQQNKEENNYYIGDQGSQGGQIHQGNTGTQENQENQVNPEDQQDQPEFKGYNVLDIDFAALNALTDDEKIVQINNYCASLTGTNKNAYTGMLRDYNLIVLCAESFATGAIDKELTPTLYRLANEGIVFNNFYNTYPNNTTDGEYTLCMGLYPDFSRVKAISSFYSSRYSYLPFCLGNAFSQQRHIQTYGYHNHIGSYYGRDESHPNIGYKMKFANDGMVFSTSWPASDLEMMQQSIDDYISKDEQFHAYYMTFSGHMAYEVSKNPMAQRNWEAVSELDYSMGAKSYLACNIELDKALEYLMQRLEEEGIADKTAIVMVGDHYPYGLSPSQYSELVGYPTDKFSMYKSTLLFWVGGLEETIVVDEYCCNADILPTILNLWGFQYDSRMLTGTDVFSDGMHVAILTDKSFFTDKMWLDANTGEVRYQVDPSEIPENYVDNMMRLIETKFALSTDILNTAYYNFIFEKGDVEVSGDTWYSEEDLAQGEEEEKDPSEDPDDSEDTSDDTTEKQPEDTQPEATEESSQDQTLSAPSDGPPATDGEDG